MKIFNKGSERRDPDTTRIPVPFSRVSRLPNFCHRFIPNSVSFPHPVLKFWRKSASQVAVKSCIPLTFLEYYSVLSANSRSQEFNSFQTLYKYALDLKQHTANEARKVQLALIISYLTGAEQLFDKNNGSRKTQILLQASAEKKKPETKLLLALPSNKLIVKEIE